MNPLLLPIAGGSAILLLLGLLVVLRRRADRVQPEDGDADLAFEDGEPAHEDLAHDPYDDPYHDDLVPMTSYADDADADADADAAPHAEDDDDRAAAEADAAGAVAWDEDADDDDDETVHTPEPLPDAESVRLRSLRAQVRTLQEALEQVQDEPDAATARSGEATFRRQVTAALRGLGERTREDESPERTLARVVAAIERLDAPDEVSRPVLPTVKFDLSGAQMSLAGPQFVAAPAALGQAPAAVPAAPMAPAPMAPAPLVPAAAAPETFGGRGPATVTTPLASALAAGADDLRDRVSALDPFAQDEEILPPPPEPDVVRPVPPPASHRDERPRRFGRRRGA